MIRSFIRYKLRMPKPCGGPLRLQGSGPWRSRLCGPEGGPGDVCATVAVDVRGRSIGAVERKGGGQGGPPDCAEIGLSRPCAVHRSHTALNLTRAEADPLGSNSL